MSASRAPSPFRVLVAWPAAQASSLRRALVAAQADVTCVDVAALIGQVGQADFYHCLCVTPSHWRTIPEAQRRRLTHKVALIALGPEAAAPADLTDARAGLYCAAGLSVAQAVARLTDVYQGLREGWPLDRCAAASDGDLAFIGQVECWPDPTAPSVQSAGFPVRPPPPNRTDYVPVGIGVLNVAGDVVHGPKTVYTTTDEQINIVSSDAAKVLQSAGGDQTNINRIAEQRVDIYQTAGGDQDNVNASGGPATPASAATRFCDQCGVSIRQTDKFCDACGSPQS